MKSELLKQAMMARYQDGGKVKKSDRSSKKDEGKAAPKFVKSKEDLPKDAVPALDESGKQKMDANGNLLWKRGSVQEPDANIVRPEKGDNKPKSTTGVKTPSKGKPDNWVRPRTTLPPKGTEQEEYFSFKEPVVDEPKPVTPEMTFGFQGRLNEYFEDPTYVNVDGKPTLIHKYSIPAQYDKKTGTFDSNTGSMDPTKVAGYYDSKGNFVGIDPFSLGDAKFTFDNNKKMVYDPATIKPSPYGANAAKLRREGAIIGHDSNQYAKIQQANEALAKQGLGEVKVNEVIQPVNTLFGGLGINKHVPVQTKKDEIAPTKGINMSLDTPPVVNDKMAPLNVKFNKGGLVGKYAGGGAIVNPNVKYGDSKLYTQQTNKGLNKLIQQQSQQLNGGGLKLDDAASIGVVGLDGAEKTSKFSSLTANEKQGLGTALDMAGTALGSGADVLDRKDGRGSMVGQVGAGALKGAGKGAAVGLNPALMALTGGNSAWIAPLAGAAISGTKAAVGFKKEQQQNRDATAEDIRNNVAQQQYSDSKTTFKSDLYNEKDYNKGLKGLFAKGGTIKGAGTGTSDSIETKIGKEGIEENSFIVPAKNNGLAKLIRKEVLEDSPNKEAKFKKGGNADIAVSNGEHLFTPAEKKKITAYLGKEILEKLAPEAEDGEDKACGGIAKKYAKGGLTMAKAKEILRDGSVHGNPLTDKQKGYFGAVAGGNAYKDGGQVNTTKRRYSTGNPALDAEIDVLYKTGNWRPEAVKAIEDKAKALGIDTGKQFLNPSAREGVFADLKYKSDYFAREVNKDIQNKKFDSQGKANRMMISPLAVSSLPKGASPEEAEAYKKLKAQYILTGKGADELNKITSGIKSREGASRDLNQKIETGKTYAKQYQLANDLKAQLEYVKKNTDKFTAKEIQELTDKERKASIEYNKLKVPSQYATNETKRLEQIYEGFAKKQYKPTAVKERGAAPVLQETVKQKEIVTPAPTNQSVQPKVKTTRNWDWG